MEMGSREKLRRKFEERVSFLPYIKDIRFPMYKALDDDLKIEFKWPITAIVGANGTNKSSVLQALYAAPGGNSLARFWFSTEVDNIDSGPMSRGVGHRFVYRFEFDRSEALAEVRKYRGKKPYRASDVPKALVGKRDPDYWEPTKRVAIDEMAEIPTRGFDEYLSDTRDRWLPIKKNVEYLDFRSELSVFDKYIHHQAFDRWATDSSRKRYRVVLQSENLVRALNGLRLRRQVDRPKILSDARKLDELAVSSIADILGKPVSGVTIVEHKLFGPSGYSVRIELGESGEVSYSEAHAGSGEFAVVRLVDRVSSAPRNSLILLDEPEVSLHPGAQKLLMRYLELEVIRNGHQVVLTTHSPAIVESLPEQAIKVLAYDSTRNRVILAAQECTPMEAFHYIGHTLADFARSQVVVEDELAAEILKASLRRKSPATLNAVSIVPVQGGANGIVKKVIPSLALTGRKNTLILLDGDQARFYPRAEWYDDLPITSEFQFDFMYAHAGAEQDVELLTEVWTTFIHETVPDLFSNSDHGTDFPVLDNCIQWSLANVRFLPGGCPERLLAAYSYPDEYRGSYTNVKSSWWKKYWIEKVKLHLHLADSEIVTAEQVLNFQIGRLAELPDVCDLFSDVARTIKSSAVFDSQ